MCYEENMPAQSQQKVPTLFHQMYLLSLLSEKSLLFKIQLMLEKSRRLVAALDKLDEYGHGVRRNQFYNWIEEQDEWKDVEFGHISKLLHDCIDDNWIGIRIEKVTNTVSLTSLSLLTITAEEYKALPTRDVEYIYVRSRGREMLKWHFFLPALFEKMSLTQVVVYGLTTAAAITLAYLGITHVV